MNPWELTASGIMLIGAAFFVSGTVGILRFPDVWSRLHAVTKADNLGLGLISLGLALMAGSVWVALKLLLIWLLAMVAASFSCHQIARAAQLSRDPQDGSP